MKASFVIPHRANLAMLQAAVGSIRGLALPEGGSVEVIVIDNGSTEGATDWARSAGCRAVRLELNEGFGRAVNRGIAHSRGDVVVVMNDDVELEADWLEHVCSALTPESWFVCGKTLRYSDHGTIDGAGDAVCRGGAAWRLGHGRTDGPLFDQPGRTYFPSGTIALFRREFFEEVGRYDETFFAYLEDVDLGLRAAMLGREGVYEPKARAYHHGSQTATAWSAGMVRWITGHQIALLSKFYPSGLLLRYGWKILVAQSLWGALAISRGRTVAWMQGVFLGLGLVPGARKAGRRLRTNSDKLAEILTDSEAQIARLQRETGWDGYWRWYFRLAGGNR